ncbi:TetR/AcrR family transcriptional regulator [Oenococcus sicerae]|uniref:TetR/AcrR family transcriptional regulator n=1 Tax=Oenococcus sicerae TaxID=2203724 RepID=A0ABX5QNT1_9LACO|nr:TetR/AcrR family transcriptional regulator [Oenococcus sicerae]QAS70470.1 TetR/AcrR family transcriptional regulator [Oenococcus sicerae]
MINEKPEKLTFKQQSVVTAALKLFTVKGYANTSTKEIALTAKVSEGSIFRHFHSKEGLLLEIINPLLNSIFPAELYEFSQMTLVPDYKDLKTFISRFINERLDYFQTNLETFRILLGELIYANNMRDKILQSIPQDVISAMTKQFHDLQNKHLLVEWPDYDIFRFIFSTMIGYLAQHFILFPEIHWNETAEKERLVDFITQGLTPVK